MKKILFIIALVASGITVQAQNSYAYINLDINTPMSNTDWFKSTSGRGGRIGYRGFIGESRFSARVDFSWAYFNQYEPKKTVQVDHGAITTDYYKDIRQYSIAASGQYNF